MLVSSMHVNQIIWNNSSNNNCCYPTRKGDTGISTSFIYYCQPMSTTFCEGTTPTILYFIWLRIWMENHSINMTIGIQLTVPPLVLIWLVQTYQTRIIYICTLNREEKFQRNSFIRRRNGNEKFELPQEVHKRVRVLNSIIELLSR